MYRIPDDFYMPIHHARPRFKDDVENVLLYIANVCSNITTTDIDDYTERLFNVIRLYPGNEEKADKTITSKQNLYFPLFLTEFLLFPAVKAHEILWITKRSLAN